MNDYNGRMTRTRATIEATSPRSAWGKGVKEDALELIELLGDRGLEPTVANMLNGASDWTEYALGGSGLIYDYDIAERYCTPSELKRLRGGDRMPNSRETWLDVHTRALYQASRQVMEAR